MASCTQPIGQSLFDFLDGKTGFEMVEAIRSGALGREIHRYVESQLDHFHIGSIQPPIRDSIWGSQGLNQTPASSPPSSVVFPLNNQQNVDLVGGNPTRITAAEELLQGLGGIDDSLSNPSQNNEPIFRSHRNA